MTTPHLYKHNLIRSAVCFLILTMTATAIAQTKEVNLYTTREPGLIKNLLDAYTVKTGIQVNTIFMKDGIAERVSSEATQSPADVLMTVDFAKLIDLSEQGVTQPIDSSILDAAVPANLRDPERHWYALSMRARVLYTSKTEVLNSFTYEQLADPKWHGKVCIRSGQHPYNNALIAHMLTNNGIEATQSWLSGIKTNLSRKATGGDRDIARDIMSGLCDIGIANSYYVGLMRSGQGGPEQKTWGDAINVIIPTFAEGGGTHVNISGAAVAKFAPNKENAINLLEYLVSDEAQKIYAEANFEYPVKIGIATDPIIADLGPLTVDTTPLTEIAKHRKAASELVDKVGFDN